jgi:fosfomycin resistance protein FosX
VSHISFIARGLDQMERVLTEVLGARKVYDSGSATFSLLKERFFLIGECGLPLWRVSRCRPAPATTHIQGRRRGR